LIFVVVTKSEIEGVNTVTARLQAELCDAEFDLGQIVVTGGLANGPTLLLDRAPSQPLRIRHLR
jgi:hypothetical protein